MKIQKITTNSIVIVALLLGIFYGSNGRGETGQSREAELTQEQIQLQKAKDGFQNAWNNELSPEVRGIILDSCGDNWDKAVKNSQTELEMRDHFNNCIDKIGIKEQRQFAILESEFGMTSYGTSVENYDKIFREHNVSHLSGQFEGVRDANQLYCGASISAQVGHRNTLDQQMASSCRNPFSHVFAGGNSVALMQSKPFQAFLQDRENLMTLYRCDPYTNLAKCPIPQQDKDCLKTAGFKSCRPFLKNSGCNKDTVLALESELSQEDKAGMTYICWKAATQGAQCCMNPDQCPTDGAFRGIASQLQKAAPGMVQAFAGLEAIKGDYQKACEANLLANAAGPLGSLKTKTCGDSVSVCEETCDKAVQNFKERFKQAVMGQQQSSSPNRRETEQEENPTTIDDIVNAAKAAIEENDLNIAKEDVDTCSKAVVYLDNLFKDKEKNKKIKSLSEKLSHASLVDCSGEVFKHSGGSSAGGASPGIPGMNPMAAQMCRQGNPAGPQAPRFPVVGPTPNPRTNQAFLTGGKTIAPGGDFVAPGVPGAPVDEFIEPDRGPAGANALQGGWTNTGGSGMGPGGGGPGGGGLTGSPSRDEGGGNGGAGDNLPMAYPEGFDMGGGGFNGGGGDLSSEDEERLRMAKYMEKRDREEERKKEEERLREIDAQGSIFSRISRTIQEWCEKENCSEE